ncbi:MAG: efflux RND transporter periplasmic adaptor subunit [Gemmatimonadetes bacterium]|nr:efflux RND transporter periplasmic adaptor subunit [Gemmatimonadota bacterium]
MTRAIGVCLFLLVAGACRRSEPVRPFDVAVVQRRDLEISAEASGVIEPIAAVEVKSKASGEIIAMPVEVGDEVKRGQLLVQVEQTDARQTYAQAVADLEVARASLTTTEAALRRAQEMFKAGLITEQEHEQALLTHANAKAQLVRAEAALELAKERLAETTVRAAIDGTIIEKTAEVGQVISSPTRDVGGGSLLLRMADLNQVQVRTLVDETDIGKIRPGIGTETRVEAFPDRLFEGAVLKIEPQAVVQQNVTMFPVIVRIDNRGRLLNPGMTAEVKFLVARRPNVLAVPNQAVHTPGDARTVAEFVLGLSAAEFEGALRETRVAGAAPGASGEGPRPGDAQAAEAPTRLSPAQRDSLRARFRRGEVSPEELRQMRARFQGAGAGAPPSAGSPAASPTSSSAGSRDGVAFTLRNGVLRPVPVRLGLTDWDYTEAVHGLQAGDTVALLPSAGLLRDQADLQRRFQRFQQGVPGMRRTGS